MKLIALETLRVTAAEPSRLVAGGEFEINDAEGQSLVTRGLAALPQAPAAKPAAKKKG